MEQGSFTLTSTGESALINFEDEGFEPNYFEFEIGPRTGTTETHVIRSSGWQNLDQDRKASISTFRDATLAGTKETTSYSFTHYKNVSSAFTKVISGYVSYTEPGGFKVTADTVDGDYTIRFKAFAV